MAMDQELQRHLDTWLSFTRFLQRSIAIVVLVLILLAFFLL
jgi:hypothetical protein